MADDRIVISSEPGATPDEVARRSFPVVFRGYDQDQVRRFLKKVSDEMVAAREREQQLRQALEEARSTLAHPELDEATLTAALGEETTRILRSAREAAADMRTKAEERVARMVQEADEQGARLDRKSTRLNSSHVRISYAVFCLKKKKAQPTHKSANYPASNQLQALPCPSG